MYAADRGHLEVVKALLDVDADPNIKDTFYQAQAVFWASQNENYEVIEYLFANGAEGADVMLSQGAGSKDANRR